MVPKVAQTTPRVVWTRGGGGLQKILCKVYPVFKASLQPPSPSNAALCMPIDSSAGALDKQADEQAGDRPGAGDYAVPVQRHGYGAGAREREGRGLQVLLHPPRPVGAKGSPDGDHGEVRAAGGPTRGARNVREAALRSTWDGGVRTPACAEFIERAAKADRDGHEGKHRGEEGGEGEWGERDSTKGGRRLVLKRPPRPSIAVGTPKMGEPKVHMTPPPPPRVQRKIKSAKHTVRTGVFVGHAVRYSINSVPKPGTQLIGSPKNTVRSVRWTWHSLDTRAGRTTLPQRQRILGWAADTEEKAGEMGRRGGWGVEGRGVWDDPVHASESVSPSQSPTKLSAFPFSSALPCPLLVAAQDVLQPLAAAHRRIGLPQGRIDSRILDTGLVLPTPPPPFFQGPKF